MKHAGPASLERLAPLLVELRTLPGLVERKPGTFYLRSQAFLHFHEDPAGLFVDVKLDLASFTRQPVNNREEEQALLAAVRAVLAGAGTR
jgi:hypothetical protein